jgi:hypothetical protein
MKRFSHNGRGKKDILQAPGQDGKARSNNGRAPSPDGKAASQDGRAKKKEAPQEDIAASYNEFKEFEGKKYTGMKIGRTHKWYYDQGEWKEKKVTPDKWQFTYAVTKRRAGRAPEGSGVPVGTEYHWYILGHQTVRKLNANDYSTSMAGMKFKVAHRRADNGKWSASERAQRKRMIQFLQETIKDLEQQAAEEQPAPGNAKPAANRRERRPVPAGV